MPFKPLPEATVAVEQFVFRDDPDGLEHRVEQRGRVPLGEDQVVVERRARIVPVVAQVPGDQRGEQVGGRHARCGVARSGARRGADRVDPQLCGQVGHHVERYVVG
jgi:hypothetical protein